MANKAARKKENSIMTEERKKMSPVSLVVNVIMTTLFFPALILLLAGNWRWVEGWILSLWIVAMILITTIYLYFKDPALLAERARRPSSAEDQKPWDKLLLIGILLVAVIWLIIQPLDAGRFHWSPAFPLWLKIIGGIALIPALYLIERAPMENTYLSTMVRIQEERKQHVITTGVYSFVRHPLYLGCLLMMLGAPLMIGSLFGLIISLVALPALIYRIIGEEKMMLEELDGYKEYMEKVKYRLIPLVW
jgi:protein-S-isoprenylcysteine O-methyltransferase Ste14